MKMFEEESGGLFKVQGLGLMWGALVNPLHPLFHSNSNSSGRAVNPTVFSRPPAAPSASVSAAVSQDRKVRVPDLMRVFKQQCLLVGILPYFIPVGGFMVTPLFDIDGNIICAIGDRLRAALQGLRSEFTSSM